MKVLPLAIVEHTHSDGGARNEKLAAITAKGRRSAGVAAAAGCGGLASSTRPGNECERDDARPHGSAAPPLVA